MIRALIDAYVMPYLVPAAIAGLVVSHVAVAWKAYDLGGDNARMTCEDEKAGIRAEIRRQRDAIEKINRDWREAIDELGSRYQMLSVSRAQEINELQEKVRDYEQELAQKPADTRCALDRGDIDRMQ